MTSRTRISLFVHNLGANPIVRAAPLASALERDFEVEVLGVLMGDQEIYAPFRDRFDYRVVRARRPLSALLAARKLAGMATGSLMYAFKPLPTTLAPALRAARGRPVLLDVEDDEWAARENETPTGGLRRGLRAGAELHAPLARLCHPLVRRVRGVTVATRLLQRRYGGELVRHGPDERLFTPALDGAAARERFGLPRDRKLALFAGKPRPHKGWEVLVQALGHPGAEGWDLVWAGSADPWWAADAAARLGPRFHALGMVSNAEMPALLAAADAVPVPQRPGAVAEAQLPAKALEGMAMGVPVVGAAVGDLPEILGEGERGWVVPPDDPAALGAALGAIARDPAESRRRAAAAHRWFLEEASVEATRRRLLPIVQAALG